MNTKFFIGLLMGCAVFLSNSASAVSVTMELETLTADQDVPFIEQGFSIVAPGQHLHATFNNQFSLPGAFTNAAQMAADTTGSLLTRVGGGAFNLLSLAAINVQGNDITGESAYAVKIEGVLAGVSQGVTLLNSGTIAVIDFSSWLGAVDQVQFSYASQGSYGNFSAFTGDDFKFDNIVVEAATVSSVPVPAAVWLFVSAIGTLGVMRRKQLAV